MSSPAAIPDLPVEFLTSSNPLIASYFLAPGIAAHQSLVDAAANFEIVREAENRAATALSESDDPAAVAYRDAREAADSALETIKSERDAQLDEIRKLYADKMKSVTNALKEQERKTLEQIKVDSVSDINMTDLVEQYTTAIQGAKILATTLKDSCPELHEWYKSLPSRTAQANGSGPTRTVDSWTPRLVSAKIVDPDGNTHTLPDPGNKVPSTLGAIAKIVGGNRKGHQLALLGSIGSPDNLSVDPENPSVYSITNNGKVYSIAVVGRDSKADD